MSLLLCPDANQPKHDLVMTPPELARRVVRHYQPTGRALEPCRGTGSFYRALASCPTVDDLDWCEIKEGRDFFNHEHHHDWIVTNPPWSILRSFLRHSMQIADNVVFLVTLTHLVTRARNRDIHAAGFGWREALIVPQPSAPWPTSGFLLAACHLQRGYTGGLTFNRSLLGRGELI